MPDDPVTIIEAAIVRLHHDVGAIVEPAVVAAFSILRTTDLPTYLRLRHKAKEANKGCLVTELDKAVQQSLPGGGDEPSALDELVDLGYLRGILNKLAEIERADARHGEFVQVLRKLARQFDFDAMKEILRKMRDATP